jgi:hypothetical protein
VWTGRGGILCERRTEQAQELLSDRVVDVAGPGSGEASSVRRVEPSVHIDGLALGSRLIAGQAAPQVWREVDRGADVTTHRVREVFLLVW